jgi:hypothetical protein
MFEQLLLNKNKTKYYGAEQCRYSDSDAPNLNKTSVCVQFDSALSL